MKFDINFIFIFKLVVQVINNNLNLLYVIIVLKNIEKLIGFIFFFFIKLIIFLILKIFINVLFKKKLVR